jgi:DNA-binding transcriptional LysR family regulator
MASVDLRLLRYFVAVAEEGLLTRAALRLGIQQPPLSQQIRQLEQELGVSLFRRLPRGMELTECGQVFLAQAYTILAQMADSIELVRRTAQGKTGHLAVGFTESAALHPLVPQALRVFRQQEPDVVLRVNEQISQGLMQALEARKLDAAFVRILPEIPPCVELEQILIESMVLALPQEHVLARNDTPSVSLLQLAAEPLVLAYRPDGLGLYPEIIRACRAAGFEPKIGIETERNLVSLSMVSAGLGIAVMSASMRHVQLQGVCYKALTDAHGLTAPLHLAYRKDSQSGALARFIDNTRALATSDLHR